MLVDIYDGETDLKFDASIRRAQTGSISFRIEEATAGGLRVGVHLGHMSVRLDGDTFAETRRYDAQSIGIYLYQPVQLSDAISMHGGVDFRFASGNDDSREDIAEIDWSEVSFNFGLGLRFGSYRIEPYVIYTDIDGDISDATGTQVFELDEAVTTGIRLDYFVEKTGFVRLDFFSGGSEGVSLAFVRRY